MLTMTPLNVDLILNKIKNNETIKLNLGVGNKYVKGYIGVDVNKGKNTDVQYDIAGLLIEIPEESIDEIYSRHTIEHFSRKKVVPLVKSWVKLLKPKGKLILDFPDLDKYIDFYIKHRSEISIEEFGRWVYGNQKDQYDVHKVALNAKYVANLLMNSGMKICSIEDSMVGNGIRKGDQSLIGTKIISLKLQNQNE